MPLVCRECGRLDEAEQRCRRCGGVLEVWGDTAALQVLETRCEGAPCDADLALDLAYVRLRAGRHRAALAGLTALSSSRPGNGRAHILLAMARYRNGDLVGALRDTRLALRLDPMRYRPPKTFAERLAVWACSSRLKQLEEGGTGTKDAYELGRYRAMFGDYAQALESYHGALKRSPEHPETLTAIGVALRVLSRPAEAAAMHRRALAASPAYALAHSNLAGALADLGHLEEAEDEAERALRYDSTLAQAPLNVGIGCLEANRLADAITYLDDAERCDSDLTPTAAAHRAAAIFLDGDAIRAIEDAAAAEDHELAHRAPEIGFVKAATLHSKGETDLAADALTGLWRLML